MYYLTKILTPEHLEYMTHVGWDHSVIILLSLFKSVRGTP